MELVKLMEWINQWAGRGTHSASLYFGIILFKFPIDLFMNNAVKTIAETTNFWNQIKAGDHSLLMN